MKYNVKGHITQYFEITVEAVSAEDAEQAVNEMAENDEIEGPMGLRSRSTM